MNISSPKSNAFPTKEQYSSTKEPDFYAKEHRIYTYSHEFVWSKIQQKSIIPPQKSPISAQKNSAYVYIVLNVCDPTQEHYSFAKTARFLRKRTAYSYIHVYIGCIHIYTCIHRLCMRRADRIDYEYVWMCMFVCMCICKYIHMYTCIHRLWDVLIGLIMIMYECVCLCVCAYVSIYTCIHVYIDYETCW